MPTWPELDKGDGEFEMALDPSLHSDSPNNYRMLPRLNVEHPILLILYFNPPAYSFRIS